MSSSPRNALAATGTLIRQVRAWDRVVGQAADSRAGYVVVEGPRPPAPAPVQLRWWERTRTSMAAATGGGAALGALAAVLTGDVEAVVLGASVPAWWGGTLALGLGPAPNRSRAPQRPSVSSHQLPLVLGHLLARAAGAQGRIQTALGTLDPEAAAAADEAAWNLAQGLTALGTLIEAYQQAGICDTQGRISPSVRWLREGPLDEVRYLLLEEEKVVAQVELLEAAAREAVIVAHESQRTVDAAWDVERAQELRSTIAARAAAMRALTRGNRT